MFFSKEHQPGELCQANFTHRTELGVTIQNEPFPHMLVSSVSTYSNWETGMVCFSENFESLSTGLQNAVWEVQYEIPSLICILPSILSVPLWGIRLYFTCFHAW